jgi:predicted NUDIX family NTP pyrophosphohydrolase
MAKESAGLLMYRRTRGKLEVLLAHPGGPFWAKRYEGAWSVPKGGIDPGEDSAAARSCTAGNSKATVSRRQ